MRRRIFRDTTAIALGLGLGLPTLLSAQTVASAEAAILAGERAAAMPEMAQMLEEEIGKGVTADQLTCLMNAPKPCTPGTPQFTPQGIAVQMVDDGSFILAPEDQQTRRPGGDGNLLPTSGDKLFAPRAEGDVDVQDAGVRVAQADGAPILPGDVVVVGGPSGAPDQADRQDDQAARKARQEAAKAARQEAQAEAQAAQKKAQADAQAAKKAAQAEAKAAQAEAKAAQQAAQAEAKAAQQAAQAEARRKTDAAAKAADPVVVAPAQSAAKKPAPQAPAPRSDADIARALAAKEAGSVPVVGGAEPMPVPARGGNAPVVTPAQPAVKGADNGTDKGADNGAVLPPKLDAGAPVVVSPAPRAQSPQSPVVTPAPSRGPAAAPQGAPVIVTPAPAKGAQAQAGRVVVPPVIGGTAAAVTPDLAAERDALAAALADAKAVPEVEAKETDAAREAAAAAAAPSAAALADSAAPVVTSAQTAVTEANSRAATEDFSTDLSGKTRDAVAAAAAAAAGGAPVVVGGSQPSPQPQPGRDPVVVGGGTAPVVTGGNGPVVVGGTQTAGGRDDDSDLEKALKGVVLPALAGLAVGQVLSNNREVALNTGDRVVVTRADGSQEILKDDNALLLRPGSTVQTEEFADGSSRTTVTREDGSKVVTIRDADLRVLRRTVVRPDGTATALIDETAAVQPVDVASLPAPAQPVVVLPGDQVSDEALRDALRRETTVDRSFTLGQVRNIPEVRALVAPVDIQAITFDTGSAAIKPDQAQALASLGRVIAEQIRQNPGEMFLIEGHTDTVGKDAMNLALSDRRAESVALALTEFFQVPPENMVVQGYGEQFLKIAREGDIRANRRAAVRRITDLLARK